MTSRERRLFLAVDEIGGPRCAAVLIEQREEIWDAASATFDRVDSAYASLAPGKIEKDGRRL